MSKIRKKDELKKVQYFIENVSAEEIGLKIKDTIAREMLTQNLDGKLFEVFGAACHFAGASEYLKNVDNDVLKEACKNVIIEAIDNLVMPLEESDLGELYLENVDK